MISGASVLINLGGETAVLTLMIAVVRMTTKELRFNATMTAITTPMTAWITTVAIVDESNNPPMETTTSFQPTRGSSRSAGAKTACILLAPFLPDPPTHLK